MSTEPDAPAEFAGKPEDDPELVGDPPALAMVLREQELERFPLYNEPKRRLAFLLSEILEGVPQYADAVEEMVARVSPHARGPDEDNIISLTAAGEAELQKHLPAIWRIGDRIQARIIEGIDIAHMAMPQLAIGLSEPGHIVTEIRVCLMELQEVFQNRQPVEFRFGNGHGIYTYDPDFNASPDKIARWMRRKYEDQLRRLHRTVEAVPRVEWEPIAGSPDAHAQGDVVTSALDVAGNAQAQGNQKRNRKYKPTGRRTKDKPLTKLQSEAVEMLNRCGANKTEAAKRLGITRQGLDAHLAAVKRRGDLALSRSVNCRRQLPTDSRGQLQVSGK